MVDRAPSPDVVEAALSRPRHRLAMPPELEARFERSTAQARTAMLRNFLAFAMCADLLAIALDAWHGALLLGLAIRLGVVAPVLLAGILSLSPRRPAWQQGLVAGVPVLCGLASIALIGLLLGGRYTELYLSAAGMAAFFVNAAMPLRLPHAAALAAATIAVNVVLAIRLSAPGDLVEILATLGFNAIVTVLTLSMTFGRERRDRDAFLQGLRERSQGEALVAANAELLRLSTTDALTGLANRRAFHARLEEATRASLRERACFGVLMLDIDHFKAFNDSAGHAAGDECLRMVAHTLAAHPAVSGGTVARLGGEEFAVLIPGADGDVARQTAESLRRAVEGRALPHPGFKYRGHVTVSVGASAMRAVGDVDAGLRALKLADDALYAAKASGRNTVSYASRPAGGTPGLDVDVAA
ncbi:GGDEF domain-containing protein [Methylobacterium sp. J-088]|uniref:GGDEF domain-containing protein n=1 Tax=Methylobacterium sp. J-088 TaxID=2836664 RepID=UPI001FBA3322|nr:GGDEF domain-containing protein [Methylobacterium sp. J-088]MCJ2061604.1 GGDEF domain-containing protein [Methylobacterium sp. J-088]